jgi:hypothetical protein
VADRKEGNGRRRIKKTNLSLYLIKYREYFALTKETEK